MSRSRLTVKETQLIQNIVNKLNAYMKQNDQTLFNLAQTTGFEYQPLHRLMKGMSTPTLASLAMLSDHINCSIVELISDEFFVDVDVIYNIKQVSDAKKPAKSRIYIPYAEYTPHMDKTFVLLAESDNSIVNRAYYLTDTISGDGEFIVIYKGQYILMDVLLSSSKFVIIEKKGVEERIPTEEIKVLARLFKHSVTCDHNKDYISNSLITKN